MPNKPGTIDWKKRLEAMKQGQPMAPSQPAVTSPAPPKEELFAVQEVLERQPESEPESALQRQPEPQTEPETVLGPESDVAQEIKPTQVSPQPAVSLPDSHGGRLANLERQLRSLKLRSNVALSLAILLLLGFAVMMIKSLGRSGRMSTTNLTISDTKGISRAWIGERDGQVQIDLQDQAGRRRLSLGLSAGGDPRLIFYNNDQQILSEILPLADGHPGIRLLNQAGETVATFPVPSPPPPAVPEPQALIPLPTPNPPPAAPQPQALAPLTPSMPQPAVVPPEAPQAQQKSAPKPEVAVKAAPSVIFVANPGGKSYHLPGSAWVKNSPPNQLLKFSSAAEAEKAGFHPGRDIRLDR